MAGAQAERKSIPDSPSSISGGGIAGRQPPARSRTHSIYKSTIDDGDGGRE